MRSLKYTGPAAAAFVIFYFTLIGAGILGWILNIMKLVNSDFEIFTVLLVLRIAGVVFPPLGGVVGWIG